MILSRKDLASDLPGDGLLLLNNFILDNKNKITKLKSTLCYLKWIKNIKIVIAKNPKIAVLSLFENFSSFFRGLMDTSFKNLLTIAFYF